ncbi:hypothetical protein BUALT_Bualt16G0077000 [Buddleja alternifolia]|uniref:Uncharacterized protein n=1 Tax=Buddleja alternifolia TaxID=168488 RepID=A0AAV6WHN5_9LAMI|nr:hypothetical protein BUALT_Bualt16G0077000 [Buddleja alternifolia]
MCLPFKFTLVGKFAYGMPPLASETTVDCNGSSVSFVQKIVYKYLPSYCSFCRHVGHVKDNCFEKSFLEKDKYAVRDSFAKGFPASFVPIDKGKYVIEEFCVAGLSINQPSVEKIHPQVDVLAPVSNTMINVPPIVPQGQLVKDSNISEVVKDAVNLG